MCGLNLLEADDEFGFAPRVSIWVVLQRQRSESLADLVLAGRRGYLQVGIVVSRGIGFDHGGGIRKETGVKRLGSRCTSAWDGQEEVLLTGTLMENTSSDDYTFF